MKDELFVQVTLDKKRTAKKLVSVCAWCPKKDYPVLESFEDYTHGLCEKHYQELRGERKFK